MFGEVFPTFQCFNLLTDYCIELWPDKEFYSFLLLLLFLNPFQSTVPAKHIPPLHHSVSISQGSIRKDSGSPRNNWHQLPTPSAQRSAGPVFPFHSKCLNQISCVSTGKHCINKSTTMIEYLQHKHTRKAWGSCGLSPLLSSRQSLWDFLPQFPQVQHLLPSDM